MRNDECLGMHCQAMNAQPGPITRDSGAAHLGQASVRHLSSIVPRRLLLGVVLIGIAAAAYGQTGSYPVKPIRLIIPFGTGGATDTAFRIIAPKLGEALGQQVVIDNRPGAGSTIGAALVANAPADGYTLLGTSNVHVLSAAVYKGLSYHPVNDFEAVAQLAESCTVQVVHPSLPARSVKELIALAKARPGKIDFATAGVGTGQHMHMALFMAMTGAELTHVPYKGSGQSVPDLIAGRVQVMMGATSILVPHVHAGRLRALAVSSARRSQFIPAVPTLDESGVKGYEATLRDGLLARKGVPAEIVARLERELQKIMSAPDVQKVILSVGSEPAYGSSQQFGALLKSEHETWTRVVQKIGIKVE